MKVLASECFIRICIGDVAFRGTASKQKQKTKIKTKTKTKKQTKNHKIPDVCNIFKIETIL